MNLVWMSGVRDAFVAGVSAGAWALADCRSVLGAAADFDVRTKPTPLGGCSAHSGHLNKLFRPEDCFALPAERVSATQHGTPAIARAIRACQGLWRDSAGVQLSEYERVLLQSV